MTPSETDPWEAAATVLRARLRAEQEALDEAAGWVRDPSHPVQRMVAMYRHYAAQVGPDELAGTELHILDMLSEPKMHAAVRRDPEQAVEDQLHRWRQAVAGVYL